MLSAASSLIYIFITALITENLVFARGIGANGILRNGYDERGITHYGVLIFAVSFPALICTWFVRMLVGNLYFYQDIKWIVDICCLAASFWVVKLLLDFSGSRNKLGLSDDVLVNLSFNSTAFAIVLLSLSMGGSILQAIVYCVGSSIGLTLAMVLIHSGKQRLEISKVHKAFQGMPISLLYIGILSMAIYGLIGHQLLT